MLAVVTGASSGIGKGYATHLAKLGYDLILVARREKLLIELKTELEASSKIKVENQILDLGTAAGAEALAKSLEGRKVDLFFNNAGASAFGNFVDVPTEQVTNLLQLLVSSLTYLTHEMTRQMAKSGGGRIINVSSGLAFWPYVPGYAMYSATKQYVLNFSRAVDEENKNLNNNVRVITLVPGVIATEFSAKRSEGGEKETTQPAMGMPTELFVQKTLPKLLSTNSALVIDGKYSRTIQFFNTYYWFAVNGRMFVLRAFLKSLARRRSTL